MREKRTLAREFFGGGMTTAITGKVIDDAERILAFAKCQKQEGKASWWFFPTVAAELGLSVHEVKAACGTLAFTHYAHVRDDFFFLKSPEELSDDLAWTTGTGSYGQ